MSQAIEHMDKKKVLGQFFTTNCHTLFSHLDGDGVQTFCTRVVEPFCGDGDIVCWLRDIGVVDVECYDIDPKTSYTHRQDTLLFPPDYTDKFIVTNPPYLSRNKSANKIIYDKWGQNDLFKCAIKSFIVGSCAGGIIIIPLSFICSLRKKDVCLRDLFFSSYTVLSIDIFNKRVFADTGYTVCVMFFTRRHVDGETFDIRIHERDDSLSTLTVCLYRELDWLIGGEIYRDNHTTFNTVGRVLIGEDPPNTKLIVYCLDGGAANTKIRMILSDTPHFCKPTCRTVISINTLQTVLSIDTQIEICERFNTYINEMRDLYHSLFLTNYRENGRKRISFDLVYGIVSRFIASLQTQN